MSGDTALVGTVFAGERKSISCYNILFPFCLNIKS